MIQHHEGLAEQEPRLGRRRREEVQQRAVELGLYSYSLYNSGLYSCGLYSYGLYSYGL